jgi:hypothetical protein
MQSVKHAAAVFSACRRMYRNNHHSFFWNIALKTQIRFTFAAHREITTVSNRVLAQAKNFVNDEDVEHRLTKIRVIVVPANEVTAPRFTASMICGKRIRQSLREAEIRIYCV